MRGKAVALVFFGPEGHVTMHNFLTPLWNSGHRKIEGIENKHILQQRHSKVASWQCQPNTFEEKNISEPKVSLMNYACHENQNLGYMMKNASAKSWSARGASRSWASCQSFHKFPYLPSRWVSLDWCSILRYTNDGSVDVQADLRREIMTLKFEVGASSEKSCLWWSVNLSACGDLNCSYWGGLKLRKLVFKNWVFSRVVLRDGRRVVNGWNDR